MSCNDLRSDLSVRDLLVVCGEQAALRAPAVLCRYARSSRFPEAVTQLGVTGEPAHRRCHVSDRITRCASLHLDAALLAHQTRWTGEVQAHDRATGCKGLQTRVAARFVQARMHEHMRHAELFKCLGSRQMTPETDPFRNAKFDSQSLELDTRGSVPDQPVFGARQMGCRKGTQAQMDGLQVEQATDGDEPDRFLRRQCKPL